MNLIPILEKRYSTKVFDPTKKISQSDVTQIKALLRLSPSSVNIQPWHFLLTESEKGKTRIAKSATGQFQFNHAKILNASLVVVFCVKTEIDADYLQKLGECEEQDGRYATSELKQLITGARQTFTELHRSQRQDLPHWLEKQVYLNMGSFLLGVATLGLDAVPMEGVDFSLLDQEFNLTEQGFASVGVVSVGYAAKEDFNASLPKSRLAETDVFTIIK